MMCRDDMSDKMIVEMKHNDLRYVSTGLGRSRQVSAGLDGVRDERGQRKIMCRDDMSDKMMVEMKYDGHEEGV